jgi:D-hexose-6-phosphate mutarotase
MSEAICRSSPPASIFGKLSRKSARLALPAHGFAKSSAVTLLGRDASE